MKKYLLFISISLLIIKSEPFNAQSVDDHFFFLNNSLVNSDPVTYVPGSVFLSGVDYNEGPNTGYPSYLGNTYSNNISMNPFCTSARKAVYNFRQKTGLKYNNGSGSNFDDYTITVIIKFNTTPSRYFRVIDFSEGNSDNGIYNFQNNLNFYPTGNVRANAFSPNNFTFLTLTRDGSSQTIDVYINDTLVTTYTDSADLYKFPTSGNIIFARDNIPPSPAPNEDTNGQIAYIHITNTKSTASEVKDVYDNICSLIPPNLNAANDFGLDLDGENGVVNVLNVLDNDTRNGVPVTLSDVNFTLVSPVPAHLPTDMFGNLSLAPNSPVGTYVLNYKICDKAYPSICDIGTVTVTVLPIPQILSTTDTFICGSGSGTLSASASAGTINWYSTPTGGTPLASGDVFVTPIVTTTTTYYVDATENWRITKTRVPVTIEVQHTPLPTADAIQTFCDYAQAKLSDIEITGTDIRWYASDTSNSNNGLPLDPDDVLTTGTYYATQTLNTCESPTRLAVDIVIYETVTIPNNITDIELCDDASDGNDTNGYTSFDLTSNESILLNGKNIADFDFTYFTDSGYLNQILTPSTFTNTILNGQTIYVRITNALGSSCYTDTSFNIQVHPLPMLNTIVELKQCDDDTDGISLFNLTEANELISSNHLNETFSYYLSEAQAQTGLMAGQISNITSYPNQNPINDVVFARVENTPGCYRTARIDLVVGVSQIPMSFNTLEYTVCDDEFIDGNKRNGIATFNFSDATPIIESLFPIPHIEITYYTNEIDALAEENAIPDISKHRNDGSPNVQNIYVRIDSEDVNACLGLGHHITLYVERLPTAHPVSYTRQCDDVPSDNEITSAFNTSNLETSILQGQNDVNLSYHKSDGSPLTDTNGAVITSPFPNTFRTASQTIIVRATNAITNTNDGMACYDETSIDFIVDALPIAHPVSIAPACDDGISDIDGMHEFDTSNIQSLLLGSQSGMVVSYFDGNGNTLPSPLPNPFNSGSQTITATVENPDNPACMASTTFDLIVNPLPEFTVNTPQIICESGPASTITLHVDQANPTESFDYSWTDENGALLSNDEQIDVSSSGTYSVTLTKTNGTNCSRTREIYVVYSEKATININDITIIDDSNNNSIQINNENNNLGQGDYEFSLDDDFLGYQDEPFFNNVKAGLHTIYVRDKNGCGISKLDVSVIGFPKFFTPNNDGHNDTWQVKGLSPDFYPSSIIYIYDRYGKLLHQINPNGNGWDGLYNGTILSSTDYWFHVQLTDKNGNIREKRGHFSLVTK